MLPILLMQTCRQVQKEVTSLFFRNITLSLRIQDREARLRHASSLLSSVSTTMDWYSWIEPAIADQFHSLSINIDGLFCKMLVTNPRTVFVHITTFDSRRSYCEPWFFTSGVLTKMSIAIRKLWQVKKSIEADRAMPSQYSCYCYCEQGLQDTPIIEEAELEKMPRVIRAATSPLDELEMYEQWIR